MTGHGAHPPHPLGCARELRVRLLVGAGDPAEPSVRLLHAVAARIHRHCGHGLLKAHRLAWGLTVEQAVAAVHRLCTEQRLGSRGLTDRSWKTWESGDHPNNDYLDLLCRLFRTGPVGLGYGTDYTPDDERPAVPAETRPAPPHPWFDTIDTIDREVIMTADESARFGDQPGNVGPLTLDALRTDARTLAHSFPNTAKPVLFQHARLLRDRIFTLLTDSGRQRLSESRELYFLAAASLGMLAEATENLGYPAQAMTHLRTGLLCAAEAGHPDLTGWLLGTQSMIAYWDGRTGQAVRYAQHGQQLACRGTVAAWLPAHEARAAAERGDEAAAAAALDRAHSARELVRDDVLDTEYGGILSFSPAKEHYYRGLTWLAVGDGPRARQAAQACIAGYQRGPAEERARDNEAIAHVNIAVSHVLDGDIDGAHAALGPALALPPELHVPGLRLALRRLHEQASAARFAGSAPADGIRDQIEDFLAAPPHALPGHPVAG